MSRNILYAAYGDRFISESLVSIASVREHHGKDVDIYFATTSAHADRIAPSVDHVLQLPSKSGYRFKIEAFLAAPVDNFVFLDSDTLIASPMNALFRYSGSATVAGVRDPLTDTLRHLPLRAPANWTARTLDDYCEVNTGVVCFNKSQPEATSFLERWLKLHDDFAAANSTLNPRSIPDQPSFAEALYRSSIEPRWLAPEYNLRLCYPQLVTNSPVVLHSRVPSPQKFRTKLSAVSDVTVILPFGLKVPRRGVMNRGLFFLSRLLRSSRQPS